MELLIRQQIYYSNRKAIPIREVAESLIALENIIRQSPSVLETMFPDTKIDSIDVFIERLKADSLLEDILIKLTFGDQKSLDLFIANLRQQIGLDKFMENPKFMGSIILALALAGAAYYIGKSTNATEEQKATIEANHNTIIQIGAGLIQLDAADFKAIIDGALNEKDKDRLAKDAIKLIKPAKRDPEATITFSNNDELKITNGSIKAMPSHVEEPDEELDTQDFDNIELEIRATDLDSSKQGWGVIIHDVHPRRVRMQLAPFINPIDLGNRRVIRADVTVIFGYDKGGNRIPKLVFLKQITD